jgi:hypothetical protein
VQATADIAIAAGTAPDTPTGNGQKVAAPGA